MLKFVLLAILVGIGLYYIFAPQLQQNTLYNYIPQYSAYYTTKYNPSNALSEQCFSLPKVKATCVNRRLMETGGDMATSIQSCRVDRLVNARCTTAKKSKEFYPYMPQFVTVKQTPPYPVRVSENVPQPYVMLKADDI